jgi:hypothetical protein
VNTFFHESKFWECKFNNKIGVTKKKRLNFQTLFNFILRSLVFVWFSGLGTAK